VNEWIAHVAFSFFNALGTRMLWWTPGLTEIGLGGNPPRARVAHPHGADIVAQTLAKELVKPRTRPIAASAPKAR
jgi:hypothetical protein